MNAPAKMTIDSEAALLEWLDTGRALARSVLRHAGLSDALIARLEAIEIDWRAFGGRPGDRIQDRDTGAETVLTLEASSAILMTCLCDQIAAELRTGQPAFRFVLYGARLIEYRNNMLAAHWLEQEERERQRARGTKGGRPAGSPARRLVAWWQQQGGSWLTLEHQLPTRHERPCSIGDFLVTLEDDGRYLVTAGDTNATSRAVLGASLRDYFIP